MGIVMVLFAVLLLVVGTLYDRVVSQELAASDQEFEAEVKHLKKYFQNAVAKMERAYELRKEAPSDLSVARLDVRKLLRG